MQYDLIQPAQIAYEQGRIHEGDTIWLRRLPPDSQVSLLDKLLNPREVFVFPTNEQIKVKLGGLLEHKKQC